CDQPDDTLCRRTINDPFEEAAPRAWPGGTRRSAESCVSAWRQSGPGLGCACLLAALLLSAGCAPTTDRDVRLAGIGTVRAAAGPMPEPCFAETGFVTADGQVLPLRRWLPPRNLAGGEV